MNGFELRVRNDCALDMNNCGLRILQVNVGFRCNLSCNHCHLECGPERSETMGLETMTQVAGAAAALRPEMVDITGGAPELNPNLRPFIRSLRNEGLHVQCRTNLTVLQEPDQADLPEFFREHRVGLVASLPCYLEDKECSQRGEGTYSKSLDALRRLNAMGYGSEPQLPLDLVYNPSGPFLPPEQARLEAEYRRELAERFDIRFSRLLTITNMPIGRFWHRLQRTNQQAEYMRLLTSGFNCRTVQGLMCRNQVCVAWDGRLYDCDFNLAQGLALSPGVPQHIRDFDAGALRGRVIRTADHCFGCTAGLGSSCAGALISK